MNYLVIVTVDAPYPKSYEYRESATHVSAAVSRALKKCKKELGRKRINEYRIKAVRM